MTKRICIIGLGQQAKDLYVPAARNSPETEIVGVLSATETNTMAVAELLGVPGFQDIDVMLDTSQPDFVIATVPHNQYLPIVQAVAKRGIHLLKGKPLARTFDEARQIVELVDSSGITMMVTVPRRFSPVYIDAYHHLSRIGSVFFSEFHSTLGLNSPADGWRADLMTTGGGCILDMGYHMIDILLWFLGMPTEIQARYSSNGRPNLNYETEDTARISYSFDASYGSMTLSRIIPPRSELVRFVGTNGSLEVRNNELFVYDIEGKLTVHNTHEINKQELARKQIEYFCSVLDGSAENIETGSYNLQHMSFIEHCYAGA